MMYFVPSWYHGNEYKENEQYFYVRRAVTEFDDSVKQIQMFNRNDIMDYKILNLSYSPNFVTFFIDKVYSMHHIGLVLMQYKKSKENKWIFYLSMI